MRIVIRILAVILIIGGFLYSIVSILSLANTEYFAQTIGKAIFRYPPPEIRQQIRANIVKWDLIMLAFGIGAIAGGFAIIKKVETNKSAKRCS